MDKGLYNYPTTCKDPERLSDKMWDVVQSSEFACKVKKLATEELVESKMYILVKEVKIYVAVINVLYSCNIFQSVVRNKIDGCVASL